MLISKQFRHYINKHNIFIFKKLKINNFILNSISNYDLINSNNIYYDVYEIYNKINLFLGIR
jgi:hypothetical protein